MIAWRRRVTRWVTALVVVGLLVLAVTQLRSRLLVGAASHGVEPTLTSRPGVWLSPEEVLALPTEGPGWDGLVKVASSQWDPPDLSDQDNTTDTDALAGALYAVRLDDAAMRQRVEDVLEEVPGTEDGARTLALARNLPSYVIAADLLDYREPRFQAWLDTIRFKLFDGRTLISTHEERPNNWGTHAGAARIALDRYLGDDEDLARAAAVFKGFLGDRESYAGFVYDEDISWQADKERPVGINAPGATIDGNDVDGLLPEEARRVGSFVWPYPVEAKGSNYVWEALQGVTVQAELLHRAGYDSWNWQDRAVYRAFRWLYEVADFPAEGDDTWQVWLVNRAYDVGLPTISPTKPGKNMAFTDWTHA
jgi:hypothetical protein